MIVLAALCGLIAFALMMKNRIKLLFKAFGDCGFTVAAARNGVRAILADAKARPGNYLLGVAIFCAFALFAEYIMLGLVALGTLATLLSAIGRWSGIGIEKRRARDLRYPLFAGERQPATRDGVRAAG